MPDNLITPIDEDILVSNFIKTNGGSMYSMYIEPFNRFCDKEAEEILKKKCSFNYSHGQYLISITYHDPKFSKPSYQGNPLYPTTAIRNKLSYDAIVSVKMTTEVYKADMLIKSTETDVDLGKIPVPVFSKYCNLWEYDDYSAMTFIDRVNDIKKKNPILVGGCLPGMNIFHGGIARYEILKEMNMNEFFMHASFPKQNGIPALKISGNTLSEAERTHSVNITVTFSYNTKGEPLLEFVIKNPPIDRISFDFMLIMSLVNIFSPEIAIKNVIIHTPAKFRSAVKVLLERIIHLSPYKNCSTPDKLKEILETLFKESNVVFPYMNCEKKDVLKFNRLIVEDRFLPHISGNDRSRHLVDFITKIVATILVYHIHGSSMSSQSEIRNFVNNKRKTLLSSRMDTVGRSQRTRFIHGIHGCMNKMIRLQISTIMNQESNTKLLLSKLESKSLASGTRLDKLGRILSGPDFQRTNVNRGVLNIKEYKPTPGNRGTAGILMLQEAALMRRTYTGDKTVREDDVIGQHQLGVIDRTQTAESNPGVHFGLTPSAIISYVDMTTELFNEIKEVIDPHMSNKDTPIYLCGQYIGNTHDPFACIKRLREFRRARHEARFMTFYVDTLMNNLNVIIQNGVLFVPAVVVYHNYYEYLTKKKKYKSNINLSPERIHELREGKIGLHEMEEEGSIEYISPIEYENTRVSSSLSLYYNTKDDPNKWVDFVILSSSTLTFSSLHNPSINNEDPVRTIFASSQKRGIIDPFSSAVNQTSTSTKLIDESCALEGNLGLECLPFDGTYVLTINAVTPFTQEEGSIINRAAVSRGLMEAIRIYTMNIDVYSNQEIASGNKSSDIPAYINDQGLPEIGTYLNFGDIILVVDELGDNGIHRIHHEYKNHTSGLVVCAGLSAKKSASHIVSITVHQHTPACEGSKMAHRTGNKGMVSRMLDPCMLPCLFDGTRAEMLLPAEMAYKRSIFADNGDVNTWSVPLYGIMPYYALDHSKEIIASPLKESGSTDVLGEFFLIEKDGHVNTKKKFFRPIATQRLNKTGQIEVTAIDRPVIASDKRQPRPGAINKGSGNISELHQDTLYGTGARYMVKKMTGDAMDLYICATCRGDMLELEEGKPFCQKCQSYESAAIRTSFAFQKLRCRIEASGFKLLPIYKTYELLDGSEKTD